MKTIINIPVPHKIVPSGTTPKSEKQMFSPIMTMSKNCLKLKFVRLKYPIIMMMFGLLSLNLSAQISSELEAKNGFKEIKILNNISTVKAVEVKRGEGGVRYKYTGDSYTLYNRRFANVYIETDRNDLIRKITLELATLEDDDFFSFTDRLKKDLGRFCSGYTDDKSGNGFLAWKSSQLYLEYRWKYSSWGKWDPVLVIGRLGDLPASAKAIYENTKDGF